MNDADLLALTKQQWAHWSGHLGIQNWMAWIEIDKNCPGAMSVQWETPYKKVSVWVKPLTSKSHKAESTPEVISRNVLHECLHVANHRLTEFGKDEMGSSGTSTLWKLFMHANEDATDTLTEIIYRLHAETGCKL